MQLTLYIALKLESRADSQWFQLKLKALISPMYFIFHYLCEFRHHNMRNKAHSCTEKLFFSFSIRGGKSIRGWQIASSWPQSKEVLRTNTHCGFHYELRMSFTIKRFTDNGSHGVNSKSCRHIIWSLWALRSFSLTQKKKRYEEITKDQALYSIQAQGRVVGVSLL